MAVAPALARPWWQVFVAAVLVAAFTAAVHWPALHARAIAIDDTEYLLDNPLVQNPSWNSTWRFLTEVTNPSSVKGYYQPLTMISLMLDCRMGGGGDNLLAFHRTSLILHAANAVGVLALMYLLFGNLWAASAVALLFGVHPMTVEPIPWIGERKTLLAAFFALGALIAYVQYARKGGWRRYLLVTVLYVLSVMSKPTSTLLPAALLLMDFWPLRRLGRRAVWEKAPLLVLTVLTAYITKVSQSAQLHADLRPLRESLLILCHNIIFYPWKMLWPVNLTSHYRVPLLSLSEPMMLIGLIGTVVLVALLVISLRWTRSLASGWLVWLVLILPAMNLIGFTEILASDKYAYLPAVGLLMILAYALARLWGAAPARARALRAAVLAGVLALAAAESVLTRQYLAHWRTTIGLYRYMHAMTPESAMLNNNLGYYVTDEGIALTAQAEDQKRHGDVPQASALAAQAREKYLEAQTMFERAIRNSAGYVDPYINYGRVLSCMGMLPQARRQFEIACQMDPRNFVAICDLGQLAGAMGDNSTAMARFEQALEIKPDFASAHAGLAEVLAAKGQYPEAIQHYQQALRTRPGDPQILARLQQLRARQGG